MPACTHTYKRVHIPIPYVCKCLYRNSNVIGTFIKMYLEKYILPNIHSHTASSCIHRFNTDGNEVEM